MTLVGNPLALSRLLTLRIVRYGGALFAVVAAMGLRLALEEWCGTGLPPFITFYPMMMAVSIIAGFGPGATATIVAAVTAAIWIIPPIGEFSLGSPIDRVAIVIFVAMGLLMSVIAEVYQRNRSNAAAYDREGLLCESQEAVRESEALFRTIFDNNLDAALLTTPDGGILAANAEARRLFGHSEEELRALGRAGVVDVADPRLARALERREAQGWFRGELTAIGAGDRKFPAEISSSIFIGRGGRRMTSMLVRDITDRQQAEEALRAALADAERANNAKSRFLAAASHDLRQPLSALSMYAGLLKNTSAPPDPKLVANMLDCIADLSDLLTDLLDLSKLEAGVVSPCVSDFAIAQVLNNVESVHGPEARVKHLKLRCTTSRLTARTDPVLFKRILGNLVDNALRYTERGGVLVACRRRQGKTWVEVWDTGIGIPADKTADIFEEFKQLGDAARNSGSGLGLAIAARTAELLGLEISVRSRPGRGSVFAIELPPGQSHLVMPTPAPHAAISRRLRVALVEDNFLVRQALIAGLRGLGHQVVASANTAALLTELNYLPPDIVVSDYRLTKGETGYDVITAVRARYGAEMPAFLITGDTDPKLLRRMTDRGIVVLHKPLDLEALQACLEDLTEAAMRGRVGGRADTQVALTSG